MIPLITPAILTDSLETFKEQLSKVHTNYSSVQIDVMDGILVESKSFSERDELNSVESEAYFELHLMVKDPITELHKWLNVANITSVVFHIESDADVTQCINLIKKQNWKAGIALNPETPLEKVLPYINMADEVLFMTVHPGHQGSVFVEEVLEKIKAFKKLGAEATCSADGGINEQTIQSVVAAGAEKLYIGSAIIQASNPEVAHENLINAIGETTI
jgi:ribulose-phosphate 3-epimerase